MSISLRPCYCCLLRDSYKYQNNNQWIYQTKNILIQKLKLNEPLLANEILSYLDKYPNFNSEIYLNRNWFYICAKCIKN